MSTYLDPIDGSTYDIDVPRWRSDAGRPLWLEPGRGISREDIDASEPSLWRYRAALPVEIPSPISLGEGRTPLLRQGWDAASESLFKLDFLNPTGSFKDRGTSVMLSYLRHHGIQSVLEDSSGNGGSSVAGYGAAGGMRVKIFAPATTSPGKIAQVRAYGADVQLVEGPRIESQHEAIRQASEGAFYASHNWQAFFLQGTKTLAYELWEDLGFQAPDNVIVPVGAGSSLLGCWLGFQELLAAGQIRKLPRLFAAQPFNCSPVDAAFSADVDRPVVPTIAEGTSIAVPLRLSQMLAAVRGTAGGTVSVSEAEIVSALRALCSRGLFVEPTSAVAAAGFTSLLERGTISPADRTVVLLTGSGLKGSSTVSKLLEAEEVHSD
ncbi:threonine synthase [Gulosibacter chungangensis]|uniref:Pyridoxal-phosphate dependent enzyme n=1 Tax=Gulosibacter chungangensis TaxID=979746 RepID=A0A7J5BBB7_9MICO|nr:threonine synthase [Gulosibacter chungangensis]KAB1643385.1 pyridoxal-phosphate dependent enzyme [Gulosibacter chungangensis]